MLSTAECTVYCCVSQPVGRCLWGDLGHTIHQGKEELLGLQCVDLITVSVGLATEGYEWHPCDVRMGCTGDEGRDWLLGFRRRISCDDTLVSASGQTGGDRL